MLCIRHKEGQWIRIGDNVRMTCVLNPVTGNHQYVFEAPRDVKIVRETSLGMPVERAGERWTTKGARKE